MKSKIKNLFAIIAILLSLSELATVANAQYVQRSLPLTGGNLTGNLIINSDYLEVITAGATANLYMQSSYAGNTQSWSFRANGYDTRFDIEHWTGSAFTHPLIIDTSDNFTISGNQTVQGSNNTMPNQTLTGSTSVMTQGLMDRRIGIDETYMPVIQSPITATAAGGVATQQLGIYLSTATGTNSVASAILGQLDNDQYAINWNYPFRVKFKVIPRPFGTDEIRIYMGSYLYASTTGTGYSISGDKGIGISISGSNTKLLTNSTGSSVASTLITSQGLFTTVVYTIENIGDGTVNVYARNVGSSTTNLIGTTNSGPTGYGAAYAGNSGISVQICNPVSGNGASNYSTLQILSAMIQTGY